MGSRERPAEAKTEEDVATGRRVVGAKSDAEVTRDEAPTPATIHAPRGALLTRRCSTHGRSISRRAAITVFIFV